jgi:hypothetical protein
MSRIDSINRLRTAASTKQAPPPTRFMTVEVESDLPCGCRLSQATRVQLNENEFGGSSVLQAAAQQLGHWLNSKTATHQDKCKRGK